LSRKTPNSNTKHPEKLQDPTLKESVAERLKEMDLIPERKRVLRDEVRAQLRAMSSSNRHERSASARRMLEQQGIWKDARKVLFYAPIETEVDVWPMLTEAMRQGKEVYLPRFMQAIATNSARSPGGQAGSYVVCRITDAERDLRIGRYGLREPSERCLQGQLNWLDLTLVPGIAFDLHGCRLGRGKGYYDRLLADVSGAKCGVAFDEQIVESLPIEPHDVRLHCILTPTRWIEFQAARGS
jgi:5-formyltetrahydrofolate cyclo-ligase